MRRAKASQRQRILGVALLVGANWPGPAEAAAEGLVPGGGGPYGVLPPDYNPEEPPLPPGPHGALLRPQVGILGYPYELPRQDCVHSKVEFYLRIILVWYDQRLMFSGAKNFPKRSWNATKQDGLLDLPWDDSSHLSIDPASIWKPDVDITERIVELFCEPEAPAALYDESHRSKHGWNVMWPRTCTVTTKCHCDMSNFPFDESICNVTWVPSTERVYELLPRFPKGKRFTYVGDEYSYTFEVDTSPRIVDFQTFPPFGGPRRIGPNQSVRLLCDHKRASEYYIANYIIPMLTLVFLMWFTFFIPIDESEKSDRLAFGVTLFLTFIAVQLITADQRVPDRSDTWIDLFQLISVVLILIPLLLTILLLRFSSFLSVKIVKLTDDSNKQEEYKDHVNGFILGIDRVSRVVYAFLALVCYMFVFGTHYEEGDYYIYIFGPPPLRNKYWEVFVAGPKVMKIWLITIIPVLLVFLVCSVTNLWRRGSCRGDKAFLFDLVMMKFDGDENSEHGDTEDDASGLVSAREFARHA